MGLFSAIKQLFASPQQLIGTTDSVCPYCTHRLGKMPGRKKKCPACGKEIYVRTRPQDNARILVRHDQLPAVDEQWSIHRANREIPTTEIIVHVEAGQVRSSSQKGDQDLEVAVEWSTAGDDCVCLLCQPLEGIVMTEQEARGMIPRHTSCRCCWTPANVGEDKSKQRRSQASIQQAIDKSIMAEIPEATKRTLSEQKQRTSWAGAKKIVAKKRPKSILD